MDRQRRLTPDDVGETIDIFNHIERSEGDSDAVALGRHADVDCIGLLPYKRALEALKRLQPDLTLKWIIEFN